MSETTRPSLLYRVRRTDNAEAWVQFERRYGPLILAYALKRGLQLSDAENIRQRVLIGLSRSLPTFTYGASRGRFRSN